MSEVVCPLPGVFYRRPSPDEPMYVEEGQSVKAGDVVGLVEVMKNYQEVHSETDGVIKNIKIEDGSVVEAGQVIAEIE
ncbi:acetyl-CoA carboxylase [Alteribacter lacisalsi]|jgi:acetyl-CoA carboxylase biotin carboxyl carrier protein|nr:acetyl-CoA carboxylase [Alteribacter lacisalsi]